MLKGLIGKPIRYSSLKEKSNTVRELEAAATLECYVHEQGPNVSWPLGISG